MPLNEFNLLMGHGITVNPNPAFFQTGSAREPYNRGQWGSALRATPQATMGDVTDGQGLQTTCTFTCHGFQPR